MDLGVSDFATLSTGEKIAGPKPYQKQLNRMKRLSKSLSRKQKGSHNRHKAKLKLSRLHHRIANIRRDAIHQLTSKLVQQHDLIAIEDLHVKGMMKNRRLSRSLADMGFAEFRRQLVYKTAIHGKALFVADRWFPSSKRCSNCCYQLEALPLSERQWICPHCKATHHRDINAAINLKKLAVSSTVTACGASSSGAVALATVSHGVMKQEFNTESA